MTPRRGTATTAGAFTTGVLVSVLAAEALRRHPPGGVGRWTRRSHAGRPVTLFEGPAYAAGAAAGVLAGGAGGSAVVAALGAAAFGALDDLAGDSSSKGLRGHLAAAARGEVTTGVIKIAGLGATGLVGARMIDRSSGRCPGERHGAMATLVGGAVIAGAANISNLLDLRPGRALKVVLLVAAPILGSGGRGGRGGGAHHRHTASSTGSSLSSTGSATSSSPVRSTSVASVIAGAAAGAAIGVLPGDLAGRSMLGDTGANSAGALLGTALVARTALRGRLLALAVVTALTLASEKVSFTTVIESTPGLRELDALGRPPSSSPKAAKVGEVDPDGAHGVLGPRGASPTA
jgi:UDP-N-acetylmuramyl pentapeptide phosphotransferase/UDP-N-acetylglucosamine-1-phosphate transferase